MSLNELREGLIVSVEGIDGSGKTTIAKEIERELLKKGFRTLYTKEPTDSSLGKAIREIVLRNKSTQLPPLTQALLFNADRNYHINSIIIKALKEKKIVIIDRFIDSTLAYQGENEEFLNLITTINKIAVNSNYPDITFLLDIEPELALQRMRKIFKKNDNFEKLNILTEVRKRYLYIAERDKKRIKILDASLDIETLVKLAINVILEMINLRHLL